MASKRLQTMEKSRPSAELSRWKLPTEQEPPWVDSITQQTASPAHSLPAHGNEEEGAPRARTKNPPWKKT